MTDNRTKENLEASVKEARAALQSAEKDLAEFIASAENNVFGSVEEASGVLEDRLRDQAFNDCEGAGNCGADKYTQEFIVDGKHYLATLSVEYNRHDKTYYYIDESEFTVTEI